MPKLSRLSLYLQAVFYTAAGTNHFINPEFYLPLIPDYLSEKEIINWVSGGVEILLGVGLITKYRARAALGIVVMLGVFIPSHIYFIQLGSCVEGSLCVDSWVSWTRLVVVHPLLMFWAWGAR